jgi:hypothetical protein
MKKELMNLFLFIGVSFLIFLLFRNFNFKTMEGMTNKPDNSPSGSASSQSGIAGNAASYGASLKAVAIKSQDTLLISKYRTDYETAILNLDDLINNLMLKTALSVDTSNPDVSIKKLSEMNNAKLALNNVMKFVDASK